MPGDRSGQRLDRDDRDRRRRVRQRVPHAVERVERALDAGASAGPCQVLGDRAAPRVVGVVFPPQPAGGRLARGAPVVEHARNVAHPRRGRELEHAERQVVVLGSLEALAESPGAAHELGSVHAEVADDVLRQEQVRAEVGLEIGVDPPAPPVELVLVAVDDVGVRMAGELGRDAPEGVRGELVVVVEQGDELAPRHRQRGVGGGRDVAPDRAVREPDPGVGAREGLERLANAGARRGVVRDAQLPARVGLRADGLDGTGQPERVGVVGRHQDREDRPRCRSDGGGLLALPDPARVVPPVPCAAELALDDPAKAERANRPKDTSEGGEGTPHGRARRQCRGKARTGLG